jgi:hypothetical protein
MSFAHSDGPTPHHSGGQIEATHRADALLAMFTSTECRQLHHFARIGLTIPHSGPVRRPACAGLARWRRLASRHLRRSWCKGSRHHDAMTLAHAINERTGWGRSAFAVLDVVVPQVDGARARREACLNVDIWIEHICSSVH